MKYIVTEYRRDRKETWYVCAPPGYWRRQIDGVVVKEVRASRACAGGPEWTKKRGEALEFTSHISAARVLSTSPGAYIAEVTL